MMLANVDNVPGDSKNRGEACLRDGEQTAVWEAAVRVLFRIYATASTNMINIRPATHSTYAFTP